MCTCRALATRNPAESAPGPRRPARSRLVECTMDETTRKNVAQALQRALDRRDNGGDMAGERR
ncbi:hypothetical protein ACPA54_22565 [Uniformispora flossi]|uniref:hypothetical protein n=1 Tax=Uniformispora flossi TaxID=3390723 RepID=UPI003C2C99F9